MKKKLVILSLFLLTNVSLALAAYNPFIFYPKWTTEYDFTRALSSIIFLLLLLVVFIFAALKIIKNYNLFIQAENIEQKRKFKIKMLIFLILPLVFFRLSIIAIELICAFFPNIKCL